MIIILLTSLIIQGIPIVMYINGIESGYGYLLVLYGICIVAGFKDKTDSILEWLTISYLISFLITFALWYDIHF